MPASSLYEQWLEVFSQQAQAPPAGPPRPSASVILWRTGPGDRLEVFLVRRSEKLRLLGGWHAFPGGNLSRSDADIPLHPPDTRTWEGHAPHGDEQTLRAYEAGELPPAIIPGILTCAVRELFEETGILLAGHPTETADHADAERRSWIESAQRRLLDREITFGQLLAELEQPVRATELEFAGRWITPPLAPVRFDTRFFLLRWTVEAAVQPTVIPGELSEGWWVEPAAIVDRWERGEMLVAPPTLFLLHTLAQYGPIEGKDRMRVRPSWSANPMRRFLFTRPAVMTLPLLGPTLPPADHTNSFLLGGDEMVLVDAGTPFANEQERLLRALRMAEDSFGKKVVALWLTHHHPDHVAAVEFIRREMRIPVCAHAATAQRLKSVGIRVDELLSDGQVVVFPGDPPVRVRVVHTPGHSPGHLCFFEEKHRSLIAGDLVAGTGTVVIDPPEGNMDDYLASLAKVRDLHPHALFPAHGGVILDGLARIEHYIEHRLWREQRVLDCWLSGERSAATMVKSVYDDLPEPLHPLAERQIVAHLERLAKMGKIALDD